MTISLRENPFLREKLIEILRRGSAPEDLIAKLEAAYAEIDRIHAIAGEIPGGMVEARHRVDDVLRAIEDALDGLDAYEETLIPRPWYRRIFRVRK